MTADGTVKTSGSALGIELEDAAGAVFADEECRRGRI